jgi:hypothetical protein
MGEKEHEIADAYLRGLQPNQRRFRIVSSLAWVGQAKRLKNGLVVIKGGVPVRTAPEGFFDLCGWNEIVVTPDMVGKKIAVFVGAEIKSEHDRLSKFQRLLGECLEKMGGVWEIIRPPSVPRESA